VVLWTFFLSIFLFCRTSVPVQPNLPTLKKITVELLVLLFPAVVGMVAVI